MQLTQELVAKFPAKIVQPNDEEFPSLRECYNTAVETKPLAIAVPKTAAEVASIVKFANQTGIDIVVRCGGHDLFGRCLAENAIVIDVRALNDVKVDKDAGRAIIGGGMQSEKLSKDLSDFGCITPCPNIATVGYIGYATTGGYGQMVHKLGFGVDHLLAAKIVDAEGNIVEADEDVMKGIRGAGGNFGIVVEATIKIYPFSEILAGPITFESTDYRVSMNKVQDGMQSLAASGDYPPELDIQPFYSNTPMGAIYGVVFMWVGPDIERGREYLNKVTSFHPVVTNEVAPVTLTRSLELNAPLVPKGSYCNSRAVNVRRMTPKIYGILVEACATMPRDFAAMLTWHEVRACSPSLNSGTGLPSVFNAREPHYVIEILANAVDKANFASLSEWGIALRDELVREAAEEILDAKWLASTPTSEIGSLEKLYGEDNAKFLRKLKQAKDPKGVFKHALPDLLI